MGNHDRREEFLKEFYSKEEEFEWSWYCSCRKSRSKWNQRVDGGDDVGGTRQPDQPVTMWIGR